MDEQLEEEGMNAGEFMDLPAEEMDMEL